MSKNEQYYKNCKDFRDQLAQIEHHIKDHKLYSSFDFEKLQINLAAYQVWAQANAGVIDEALKPVPQV